MSAWRVEKHYGFGAAKIPIQPEAHASVNLGFIEGFGVLFAELGAGGPAATMRRVAGETPAILLGLLLLISFVVTISRDRVDDSTVEVVLFDTPNSIPEPIAEELVPEPAPIEIAKPEPPKPVSVPVKPKPKPQMLAEQPKPVPPPPPVVRPTPKPKMRPKPMIPQMAKLSAPNVPKVPRLQKMERATRERPDVVARPRIAIDAAKPKPVVTPALPRMDRVARASADRVPQRKSPRMTAPTAPALELPTDPAPQRAFRVAKNRPTAASRSHAMPGLAAVVQPSESAPPPAGRRARTNSPRAITSSLARRPAARMNRNGVPAAPAYRAPEPRRATRQAPRAETRRAPRPSGAIGRVAQSASSVAPIQVARAGRASPTAPRGSRADRPGVAGVPLGDLAACLSDRDEDRLKQAVVAAVTTQDECVSNKGTYRFIETKNLNAFLMWIDRAPSRPVSDRCEELGYALECLNSASQRAAR